MVRPRIQALLPAIWDKYVPKVDEDGEYIESNDDGTWEGVEGRPDPTVVWCGPFLDALVHFGVFRERQSVKVFMFEANDGAKKANNTQLHIARIKTPVLDSEPWNNGYNAEYGELMRLMSLPGRSVNAGRSFEPGDVIDSAVAADNAANPWDVRTTRVHNSPTIAIDPVHKLHILYRGDKIRKKFKAPGLDEPVVEEFVLRKPSEGSSRIRLAQGQREVVL